jgi:DNA-binding PadR family transcriptional regulator
MSLKHAILGFLDMMPLSGYDLKKMFDSAVKYYWSATHSQIYRTLSQLADDGLVQVEIVQQIDHPNKKIYHITEEGKQELHKWLVIPQELPIIRHKLLIQLSWADRLEDEQILILLEDYAQKVRKRLELYRSKNQLLVLEHARTERERYLWQMTLENGILMYECELAWVTRAIEGISNENYFKEE